MSPNQYIGAFFEIYGAMLLKAKRINENNFNEDHDWILDGYRVNSKAALVKSRDNKLASVFKLHLAYLKCDFFWLVAYEMVDDKPVPVISWLIPSNMLEKQYAILGVANKGKFADYEVPIDYKLLKSKRFKDATKHLKITERDKEYGT